MNLNPAAVARINEEEEAVNKTISILSDAQIAERSKLYRHSHDARALTAEIVNSRRDLEKQMLANDESVSHSLSKRAQTETEAIAELLDTPYFARLVLEEDVGSSTRLIEYKLGKRANIDARIIDWKNAPLAKLFYEYQEGETYLEDIRGQERSGRIALRNKVVTKSGILKELDCPVGRFKKTSEGTWEERSGGKAAQNGGGKFELPSILSLISAEQFRLITEDAAEPVLLHGVAGSGKTSVALHRLAWQLAKTSDKQNPIIISPTELLAKYIRNSLEALDVPGIPVITRDEWFLRTSRESGLFNRGEKRINTPPHIARVKSSLAIAKALFHHIVNQSIIFSSPQAGIIYTLGKPDILLEEDKSRLIKIESIREAHSITKRNYEAGEIDSSDTCLLLLAAKLMRFSEAHLPSYSHLFLDEFQEISPVELAFIGSCVKEKENITMTGDIAQHTTQSDIFQSTLFQTSLESLTLTSSRDSSKTQAPNSLTISHRSSLPIMRYADYLLGEQRTSEGRPGKPPLLVLTSDQDDAIQELIGWTERVGERYPGDPVIILCKDYAETKELLSLLQPSLGERASLLSEAPRETGGMILLALINHSKGLEFPHVGIWDVSRKNFPATPLARRELYLAATRAEEHLTLFAWEPGWSPILPGLSSKLHRIYDVRREKEEEEVKDLFD